MSETPTVVVSGLRKGTVHRPRHVHERCRAVLFGENGGLFRFGGHVGSGLFVPTIMAGDGRLDTLEIAVPSGEPLALYFIPVSDELKRRDRLYWLDLESREQRLTFRAEEDGIALLGADGRLARFSDYWQTELGQGELLVAPPAFFLPAPLGSTRRPRLSALASGC
jgi:hypothetical protein